MLPVCGTPADRACPTPEPNLGVQGGNGTLGYKGVIVP